MSMYLHEKRATPENQFVFFAWFAPYNVVQTVFSSKINIQRLIYYQNIYLDY